MAEPSIVIIVMGVAGSGKSTVGRLLAQELGWAFYDADDDHSVENIEQMRSGRPLTDAQRQPWLATLRTRIGQWLAHGSCTVLACSALTKASRSALAGDNPRVRFVHLQASRELIRSRITKREHFMSPMLLDSQFDLLEQPADAIVVQASQPPRELVRAICAQLDQESK